MFPRISLNPFATLPVSWPLLQKCHTYDTKRNYSKTTLSFWRFFSVVMKGNPCECSVKIIHKNVYVTGEEINAYGTQKKPLDFENCLKKNQIKKWRNSQFMVLK